MSNALSLKPGTRLRTGGTTYEVTEDADISAGIVEVVPQTTRLLKVHCETCKYTARITQRWITKAGTPDCPSGHGNMVVAPTKPKPDAADAAVSAMSRKLAAVAKRLAAKAAVEADLTPIEVVVPPELIPTEPEPTIEERDSVLADLLANL